MQRIDVSHDHVTRLSALFQRADNDTDVVAAVVAQDEVVDPRAMLDIERLQVLEQAREAGHAQGLESAQVQIREAADAARRDCEAEHADALARLRDDRERLSELLRRLPGTIADIEDGVAEFAAELAYTALLRVLDEAPARERMASLCRQALREQHRRPLVLRVAAADAAALDEIADGEAVRLEIDARLQPGQCQLDSGLGVHDTGLDVRLDALKQAFLLGLSEPAR